VSKVALLKFSNEYIVRYTKRSRSAMTTSTSSDEIRRSASRDPALLDDETMATRADLLDMDMLEGEEDDLGDEEEDEEDEMEVDESASTRRTTLGKVACSRTNYRVCPGSASSNTSTKSGRRVAAE
jgi:hypothetical protein